MENHPLVEQCQETVDFRPLDLLLNPGERPWIIIGLVSGPNTASSGHIDSGASRDAPASEQGGEDKGAHIRARSCSRRESMTLEADSLLLEFFPQLLLVCPLDDSGAQVVQLGGHLVVHQLVGTHFLNYRRDLPGQQVVRRRLLSMPLSLPGIHVPGP